MVVGFPAPHRCPDSPFLLPLRSVGLLTSVSRDFRAQETGDWKEKDGMTSTCSVSQPGRPVKFPNRETIQKPRLSRLEGNQFPSASSSEASLELKGGSGSSLALRNRTWDAKSEEKSHPRAPNCGGPPLRHSALPSNQKRHTHQTTNSQAPALLNRNKLVPICLRRSTQG